MTNSPRQPHRRPGPTDGAPPTRASRTRNADERETRASPTRNADERETRASRTRNADERETRAATLRRAVLGGAAGITILVGPVVMASALLPDGTGGAVAVADGSHTSQVALRQTTSTTEPTTTTLAPTTTAAPTTTTTAPPTTTTAPPTTTTTTAPPTTEPPPPDPGELPVGVDNGAGFPDPNSYETWDRLAGCESGGRWDYSAGPYYGGLQFSASTWQSVGGPGMPYEYPRETQIYYGQILQARSGWGQWPHCSAKLGLS